MLAAATVAAVAAGRDTRMLACKTLSRVKLLAWKSTNPCVKSHHLLYFQKCKFFHGLSCELKMDVRKGKQFDTDHRKRKIVTQTWRAVPTQTNLSESDSGKGKLQSNLEEVNVSISSFVSTSKTEVKVMDEPVGPDTCSVVEGSDHDASLEGKLVTSEKHSVSMEIGASLMRFIKGKGGSTQEEIENESGVKIIFPSSRKEDSIFIEGNSAESLTKASQKIQIIIDKAVNSRALDYSHFVSLPLAIHPGLVNKLVDFQNNILGLTTSDKGENLDSDSGGYTADEEDENQHSVKASIELEAEDAETPVKVNVTNIPLVSYRAKESKSSAPDTSSSKLIELGIEKSIFIKPKTFHLTVLMLKLWNKDRVKKAAEVLQSVSSKVIDALENRPVMIRLKGLDCMKGSLTKARVLYAPVEEIGDEGRLLQACQVITDAFIEAGLVMKNDEQQKLKLHATLMNARHRKRRNNTKKADSFDARGIFDQYGCEEWGEYRICEAHLSQRFVFDENGYYYCCASIPFPKD